VQEALFLSSLEVGKHIDTFPIFFLVWFIVYRVVLYENSHGSTGKVFDFSHYATMSLAVTNWFYDHRSSSIQFHHGTLSAALHVSIYHLSLPPLYWGHKPTTIKIMLGHRRGCFKKRIVLGNFLFNLFVTIFAYFNHPYYC
jgi:hypothetical protein